jgi:hypothetical protein
VGRPPQPVDTGAIVRKIRISYTALRAALVDPALRRLLLCELMMQSHREGESLVVPQGMRFQPFAPAEFNKYKQALSELNSENANQVR